MSIFLGQEAYRKFIERSNDCGKWESWKENCYENYKEVYDYLLENIYMADITIFKEFVNRIDMNEARQFLESDYFKSGVHMVSEKAKESSDGLNFSKDYDVFILMGFGHISGTAGVLDKPFVYYGLENYLKVDFNYIVPHEINHMVRLYKTQTKAKCLTELTVGDILISEGLGIVYPLVLNSKKVETDLNFSIGIREEQYSVLVEKERDYIEEMISKIHCKMTKEIWYKYFVVDNSKVSSVTGIGYYVGAKIIYTLIEAGYSITELTGYTTDSILQIYKSII